MTLKYFAHKSAYSIAYQCIMSRFRKLFEDAKRQDYLCKIFAIFALLQRLRNREFIDFGSCNRFLKNKMLQPLNKSLYLVLKV